MGSSWEQWPGTYKQFKFSHRQKAAARDRAKTRLAERYPNIYKKFYEEELQRAREDRNP